jgi:hypothetical protein
MLLAEQNMSLENVIHELGYADLKSFANQQAQEVLWKKIKNCEEKIKIYEAKYQTDYQGFVAKFHTIKNFGIFEKEDDSMIWETEISLKNHYLEMIKKLVE